MGGSRFGDRLAKGAYEQQTVLAWMNRYLRALSKRAAVYPSKGVFRTRFGRRQAVCFLLQVVAYREVLRVRSVEQQVPID